MKSVSITPGRRKRGEPVPATESEAVSVTTSGTLRIFAEAHYDRDKAVEAAKLIRQIGAKYKPSKKHSGTKALRDLRDDGK